MVAGLGDYWLQLFGCWSWMLGSSEHSDLGIGLGFHQLYSRINNYHRCLEVGDCGVAMVFARVVLGLACLGLSGKVHLHPLF